MNFSVETIISASVLSLSLSLDALAASFAYGCGGTKIPFKSAMIINIVCTAILAIALYLGTHASRFIPEAVGVILCFSVLVIIGSVKLYQGLRQGSEDCPERGATLKTLKPIEAVVLATGLSLDGLAAGFGAALGGTNAIAMLIVSLVAHMVAVPLGCMLGMRLSKKTTLNISWIGGGVIIILAFTKLLY